MRWHLTRVALALAIACGSSGAWAADYRPPFTGISCSIEGEYHPESRAVDATIHIRFTLQDTLPKGELVLAGLRDPDEKGVVSVDTAAPYKDDPLEETFGGLGTMKIYSVSLQGEPVSFKRDDDDCVVKADDLPLGDEVDVGLRYTVSFGEVGSTAEKKGRGELALAWYPMIEDAEDPGAMLPADYEVSLNLPNEFNLIATGDRPSSQEAGAERTWSWQATGAYFASWVAGKNLRRVCTTDEPVRAEYWTALPDSGNCKEFESLRPFMRNSLSRWGRPHIGESPVILCSLPFGWGGNGASVVGFTVGNLIVVDPHWMPVTFKLLFRNRAPEVNWTLVHELIHLWWIGRMTGPISSKDGEFHEAMTWAMTQELYDEYMEACGKEEHSSKLRSLLLFKPIDLNDEKKNVLSGYLAIARAGRGVTVLEDDREDTDFTFPAYGKAIGAYRAFSRTLGKKEWNKRIRRFYELVGREALTFDAFCRLNPDIEGELRAWFETPKECDYALGSVTSRALEDGGYETRVEVRRNGDISMPVPVEVSFKDGTACVDTLKGCAEADTLVMLSRARFSSAVIDPDRWLPDYDRTNNASFRKWRFDINRVRPFDEGYQANLILMQIPLIVSPNYSSEDGWTTMIAFTVEGPSKDYGILGSRADNSFVASLGYGFKGDLPLGSASYSRGLTWPGKLNTVSAEAFKSYDSYGAQVLFSAARSKHQNRGPVQKLSVGARLLQLTRPSYRKEPGWGSGRMAEAAVEYEYSHLITKAHPVEGFSIDSRLEAAGTSFGGEWPFAQASVEVQDYHFLPAKAVLALRGMAGASSGRVPLQNQFDLTRHGQFHSLLAYVHSGKSMTAATAELRFRKRLPLVDPALFATWAALWPDSDSKALSAGEAGLGLRLGGRHLGVSLDFALWQKTPLKDGAFDFRAQVSLGVGFGYSSTRWF